MKVPLDGLAGRVALDRIWAALPEARLVGGAVRDLLAGRVVTDVDLATPDAPEAVQDILTRAGIKVVPTGLAHGTVTAVIQRCPVEITTLRRDVSTDGRHAVVEWTSDWQEDAARRDFTINAMSCDQAGQVHDYFGGAADLAAGRVRFVGDPAQRITEDALRILRFFRFQGRYGLQDADATTLAAIAESVPLIQRLSVERIWSELRRILEGPRAVEMVRLMEKTGVLPVMFPEGVSTDRLARLVAAGAPEQAVLRLAALIDGDAEQVATRLRLSRDETARLLALRAGPIAAPDALAVSDDDLARLLADHPAWALIGRCWLWQAGFVGGSDAASSDVALSGSTGPQSGWSGSNWPKSDWNALRARIEVAVVPAFPLSGRDAVALGIPAGPGVGQSLAQVRRWWLEGGCRAGRDACLDRLKSSG